MTVKQCYEQIGAEYDDTLKRFGNEAFVRKFALVFLDDPGFAKLKESIEENDGEEAFRAAHTLKGVCLNLGFTRLYQSSAELTEKLRGQKSTDGCDELFKSVSDNYYETVNAIKQIDC